MKRDITRQDLSLKDTVISAAISIAIGLSAALLCLYGAALLISGGTLDEGLTALAASLCCAVGSFVSGFLAGRSIRKRILIAGLFTGIAFMIILALLGALFFSKILPQGGFIPICVSCLIGAVLGSIASSII
ncbi:MAG: TIGR04086 family membrane protein [Oscillospiraceae bacterium]|nr:TIGR04086 family membrane protein [Oscillospiraceae bacterium]